MNTLPACMSPWNSPCTKALSIHARIPVRRMSSRSWPAARRASVSSTDTPSTKVITSTRSPTIPAIGAGTTTGAGAGRGREVGGEGRHVAPPRARRSSSSRMVTARSSTIARRGWRPGRARRLRRARPARSAEELQVALDPAAQVRAGGPSRPRRCRRRAGPGGPGRSRPPRAGSTSKSAKSRPSGAPQLALDDPDDPRAWAPGARRRAAGASRWRAARGTGRGSTP